MKKLIFAVKAVIIIAFVILLQSCATFKQQSLPESNPVDSVIASKFFDAAQISVSVYDLTDNKPVYLRNEKLLLHPASNQKILITTAAYLFLGKNYNFETSVYHTGEIKDSVCSGDLYFVGGFDPDFSLLDLDSLIQAIKKSGIKKIEGNLYADVSAMDSLFWGAGWMWDDDPYSFLPYLTPLNINKDNITVVVSPSIAAQPAEVSTIPKTAFFEIKNRSITVDSGKSQLNVTRDWISRKNTIEVSGTIKNSSAPDTTRLNVFNPNFYFLELAKEKCELAGIKINGKLDTLTAPQNCYKIFSVNHSIDEAVRNANKNSDNLNAEMILRALGNKYFGKHTSADDGLKLVDSLIILSGFNPKNYLLVDGSGLSHYNLVSAELIDGILKYIYYSHPNIFQRIFDSFPVSGYNGTLRNRMKETPLVGRIHGKTGTLRGISALSGYIESKENHLLSFSILVQNYVGSSKEAHAIQDELCKIFYRMN